SQKIEAAPERIQYRGARLGYRVAPLALRDVSPEHSRHARDAGGALQISRGRYRVLRKRLEEPGLEDANVSGIVSVVSLALPLIESALTVITRFGDAEPGSDLLHQRDSSLRAKSVCRLGRGLEIRR